MQSARCAIRWAGSPIPTPHGCCAAASKPWNCECSGQARTQKKVCAFLAQHPKVEGLGYLGMIKDDRQKDIYDRHCLGAGSTFSLFLKGGEAECFRFLDALKVAKLAVSLGGTETLASHPASMTHLSVAHGRRQELGITDSLVRISIGIEDADDLIADFEQALEAV